ncbi:uncharacterized protein [Euphorbia lathyris]|uniref:uncharacterized protein n=1 Tax=Euphorbia lathyris TaxID=212925 RepID=UPI0033136F87
MASIAYRSQPDLSLSDFLPANNNARTIPTCNSIAFSRNYPDRKRWRISAASTKSPDEIAVVKRNKKMIGNDDNDRKDRKDSNESNDRAIVHEKVDEWMRESVTEIVKNLRGAPLLVQVYEGGETTTLAVEEETWPAVMENWGKKEVPVPEGVIFVDQLEEDAAAACGGGGGVEEDEITRAWGIVVQGKGEGCGPVCYLLKTSRVCSESGRGGSCCTHFCLMKVKSFRESAMSQLKNCWLLQAQLQ